MDKWFPIQKIKSILSAGGFTMRNFLFVLLLSSCVMTEPYRAKDGSNDSYSPTVVETAVDTMSPPSHGNHPQSLWGRSLNKIAKVRNPFSYPITVSLECGLTVQEVEIPPQSQRWVLNVTTERYRYEQTCYIVAWKRK